MTWGASPRGRAAIALPQRNLRRATAQRSVQQTRVPTTFAVVVLHEQRHGTSGPATKVM